MCHCAEGTFQLPVHTVTKRSYVLHLAPISGFIHLFEVDPIAFDSLIFESDLVEVTRLIAFLKDQLGQGDRWVQHFVYTLERYVSIKADLREQTLEAYRASVVRAQKHFYGRRQRNKELKKRLHHEIERTHFFKSSLEEFANTEDEPLPQFEFVESLTFYDEAPKQEEKVEKKQRRVDLRQYHEFMRP